MDVAYYPYFESNHKVAGIVINARDATQTKLLEEKLVQAQKMEAIGTLAGGVAHDFNNILGAIIGYSELLLLEVPETGEAKDWVRHVLAAAERARNLVKQILAFSRQSEQMVRPIKLEPIVDEAVSLIRASIPSTIDIKKDIRKTSGSVMADPTQVHQVLINLCTNSAHAMKETGGLLFIGLEEMEVTPASRFKHANLKIGHYFKIIVRDTGHGIPPEHISRIFDPYFTTKEKGVGTGLGLATVHGIIKSYEGFIEVVSNVGVGTVFTIFLPKIDLPDSPISDDVDPIAASGQGRVLLVDDEESLLKVVKHLLQRLGYQVETTHSPVTALDIFEKEPQRFDLVITDQTMPKMTGDELAVQMMKIRADIPIILCTGFSDLIDENKAKAMGIREYLKKPLTLRALSDAVRKVMTGR